MITQLDLTLFKCFELLKLPLHPLTLLSGANASGKSAILQALVLLHQTIRDNEWSNQLLLNGSVVRLGTASDVIDQVNGKHEFGIELVDGDQKYSWKFRGDRDDMTVPIEHADVDGASIANNNFRHLLIPNSKTHSSLSRRLKELTYLKAERLGPQETYPLENLGKAQVVGSNGEFAVSVLYENREKLVTSPLIENNIRGALLQQVEARMSMFFPGCALEVNKVPGVNAATLGLRTSSDTKFHNPINTGFGLTQVLPIVVSALMADKDSLILIENPEVHLHPAGQAAIGVFLAEVANAGIQVIIETHSDHVLNGIRRAVKSGTISSDQVALHFFRPRNSEHTFNTPQVQSPIIDPNGNIDSWPDGFFDQFDTDMNYFAGWS